MVAKALNLIDLDFLANKADLIEFLRNQPLFKDFDFAGSNMNLLCDLLAYNSNKHGFLTNMLLSEAHIDSAQLQSSVFSKAKELNYTPRSARSAIANVTVNFTATGASQPYIIPKGSSFSTSIKNNSYVFTTAETISVSSPNSEFTFTTNIYEGIYVKDTYVFNATESDPYPRFRITNKNVDTSSLVVAVFQDNTQEATTFQPATSLLGLDALDKVFFLQTGETGFYEIQFGDSIVGYAPKENSVIVLEYRVTNAQLANGAKAFDIGFDPTGVNELNDIDPVTIHDIVTGGATAEQIESVRYFAPRHFQTQERCVVPTDYEILLKIAFPEINSVVAYGGEQLDPPRYGYVVVSIDLSELDTLPISKEKAYNEFLLARMPMSLKPLFVDPVHLYAQVNSVVRYNKNITLNTPAYIKSLVTTSISNYNIDHLDDFKATLRYSALLEVIDDSDPSIISNITTIRAYKKFVPSIGAIGTYVINFGIPIKTGISSTGLTYKGTLVYLEDDGNGVVSVFQYVNAKPVTIGPIGTIDYDAGIVTLNHIIVDAYIGNFVKIYAEPVDPDITTIKNSILSIESDEVFVTTQALSG